MKAIIDPLVISKVFKSISPLIGHNVVMPITACVKMSFNKKELFITGTNIENTSTIQTECECKTVFDVVVPFEKIKNLCEKEKTPLTLHFHGTHLEISGDSSKGKINTPADVKDFPKTDEEQYDIEYEVDGDFFHAIGTANALRDTNETMYHRCRPAIDMLKSHINVVAANGASFFKKKFNIKTKKERTIMLSKDFSSLVDTFQAGTISISEKFIKAKSDKVTVVSQLWANPFFQYALAMPEKFVFNGEFDRKDMLQAVDYVSIAADKTKKISLNFGQGILVSSFDRNIEDEMEKNISYRNDNLEVSGISLSSSEMIKVLNRIKYSNVQFGIEAEGKPMLLQPTEDPDSIFFIAPLVN